MSHLTDIPFPGWLGQPKKQPSAQSVERPAWLHEERNLAQPCRSAITEKPTFYGMRELRAERDMGNGDIVQNEVEPSCTLHQVVSNQSRNLIRTVSAVCQDLAR